MEGGGRDLKIYILTFLDFLQITIFIWKNHTFFILFIYMTRKQFFTEFFLLKTQKKS
jgi:hypothetical protein